MVADEKPPRRFFQGAENFVNNVIIAPVEWFRETVVVPNQKEYYWYHQKYRRVPTIDQCYDDDPVCKWEAKQQFKRDHQVDSAILSILRRRYETCMVYESPDNAVCKPLYEAYQDAAADWFSKYGDLGVQLSAEKAYMKQKHRMIWERRHGKIGSGTADNRPENYQEPQ